MRSLTVLLLISNHPLNVRREERVGEEEHVSAIIYAAVNLIIPRIRKKHERYEGVAHKNEAVKLEKDPGEQPRFPSRL